jgi:DNA-binding transcriptional LysR family regulator
VLTPDGEDLLRELEPHLRAIHQAVATPSGTTPAIRVAAAESLLTSWLAPALAEAATESGATLELHAHRGPLVLERVRSGRADIAICVSEGEDGLDHHPLAKEPLVLLGRAGAAPPDPAVAPPELWTIEARSQTGEWLTRRLRRLRSPLVPTHRIESFGAAVQLARAGFGVALVPEGIARALGVPAEALTPVPGLARPVAAACAPTTAGRPAVKAFLAALTRRCGLSRRSGS